MILSMTGYGAAKCSAGGLDISIELKSVNNRYLDVAVRLPRNFLFAEETVKSLVQKHISRGKVDVFVTVDQSAAGDVAIKVNEPLVIEYAAALRRIGELTGAQCVLSAETLARMPDVLTAEKKEADRELIAAGISECLEEALRGFDEMRGREGDRLCDDIAARLVTLESMTGEIERRSPEAVADYRAKLTQRMCEVLGSSEIDETRILTEAAIFADRTAVDEETVRLRSHIAQLRLMLESGSPIGRKIDFLIQELNRETNTIGSKFSDAAAAKLVVDMKAEIEKIREQVQNIE